MRAGQVDVLLAPMAAAAKASGKAARRWWQFPWASMATASRSA